MIHANIVASRMLCSSKETLVKKLESIINEGGEGLIVRKPKSLYESGRSINLLKLKVSRKCIQIVTNWFWKAARGDREGLVTKLGFGTEPYVIQLCVTTG